MIVEDKHICSKCKKIQQYYADTWLCPKCDAMIIWELWWEKEFRKGKIYKFEKV